MSFLECFLHLKCFDTEEVYRHRASGFVC